MISFLRGTVAHVGLSSAVIDLNGAGMSVNATPQTLSGLRVGEEGKLFTSLIVREDSLTLFGFSSDDEREVFDILLSVSGVGPRLALAVLAVHDPEAIRVAAHTGDGKAFTKVPGIGPKVAGRIVLELAGKLVPHGTGAAAAPGSLRSGRLEAAGGGGHDQPRLVRKGRHRPASTRPSRIPPNWKQTARWPKSSGPPSAGSARTAPAPATG